MSEEAKPIPSVDEAAPKLAEPKPRTTESPPRITPAKAKAPLPPEPETEIEQVCRRIITLRKRPLLVLFYPSAHGSMEESDVADCYDVFRNGGRTPEDLLDGCDVLLHTTGGNPVAGYRLAQCIRNFARDVVFLVPEYAYSAGTLLCFSGDEVRLGHYAGMSPIDITMVEWLESGRDEVELASFDYYLQFTDDCQRHIQKVLAGMNVPGISDVGDALLCRLVDQVGALRVGEYYRARTLTGHYAEELLDSYMLAGKPNSAGRRDRIIRSLLFGKPAHQFHLDYHMCGAAGLEVGEMDTVESDATKDAVKTLGRLARAERICLPITDDLQQPFIGFFPLTKQP
jgi:hypothetical protein